MFSRRVGQSDVQIFGTLLRAFRRRSILAIGCAVVCAGALAIGISVAAAQWSTAPRGARVEAPASMPFAAAAHRVSPATAFDVSATAVSTVSAASFESVSVAPDSIVSAFGAQLATQTLVAADADPSTPGVQLPTQLAGTTVEVNGRRAGLFFVSAGQINYQMPAATETGAANVVVKSGDGTISNGTVQIVQVAPSVFTANANGRGVPAATILRVKSNGQQSTEPLYQYNEQVARFVTKPIDLGPDGERIFLILFLTGVRRANDDNGDGNVNESIRLLIGGNEITPIFAGRQADFVGLDQINAEIPRSLLGRGICQVSVTATGFSASNLSEVEIAGATGPLPPQVSGFGASSALAGQQLTITGNGFSTNPADNLVRISGLDAEVVTATATSLTVMVPFGVETGTVSVRTAMGEGVSTNVLPVRTSISGTVENTTRQPLIGVQVKLTGTSILTTTNSDGAFVLPDVPQGVQSVEVDGGTIGTNPPYPKVGLKITASLSKDNQFSRPIALQQATGSSATVGSGGSSLAGAGAGAAMGATFKQASMAPAAQPTPITIQTGEFKLEVPGNAAANFPTGATFGSIALTPLTEARTPVDLPVGYFSTAIVQITPFNVSLNPGAKLILPNTDNFPANAPAILFRYDPAEGRFIQEAATAAVSADGKTIETQSGAIKVTSFYFAAVLRSTTTISGRVFERDGKTPVIRALIRFRGREAFTDGNGSYVLRFIPLLDGERVSVEASIQRASGRVDRAQSSSVPGVLGGTTKVPPVLMPGGQENRPPSILVQSKIEVDEGKPQDIPVIINDPDPNQTIEARIQAPSFVTFVRTLSTAAVAYELRIAPNFTNAGEYPIKVTATDNLGASTTVDITLVVRDVNRLPVAIEQAVTVDEDASINVRLEGTDADADPITYMVVSAPASGVLSGQAPNLSYKPNPNFVGIDRFQFKVNDGKGDSNIALVVITVRPVNDPPVLTVPAAQTVNEGQALSFNLTASDIDGTQGLVITSSNLPGGASLTAINATTAQFKWTPGFTQAGVYNVSFKVTDAGNPPLSDTREVRITVNDLVLFTTPAARTVNEGQAVQFDVLAGTGLPAPLSIVASSLPDGAGATNPAAGVTRFAWTPNFTQAGRYTVNFTATLNTTPPFTETKQVQITVFDVQRELSKEPAPFSVLGGAGAAATAAEDGDLLGTSVAVGDLNGDGIGDLAIGAPGANAPGTDSGRVYVFYGKTTLGGIVDLSPQKADLELIGEADGDRFGTSLAIGDLNGDGKNDLLIGAPLANSGAEKPDAGKVYAVFGNLGTGSSTINAVVGVTFLGGARSDNFGASLAMGFIHTKNGPAVDLLVGAPAFDNAVTGGIQADAGAVYGFFGGASLTKQIDASAANFVATGPSAGAQMGFSLAAGNFNGDDFVDFATGAPGASGNNLKANGQVFLVAGAETLTGAKPIATIAALTLFGVDDSDRFGAALAMGDLNGDSRADLAIGVPGGDGPANARAGVGEVAVVYGNATIQGRTTDWLIFGAGLAGDQFADALGESLAMGDFSGDGLADLAAGAPGADLIDPRRSPTGAVYLLFGARAAITGATDLSTKPADLSVFGTDSGDLLGRGGIAIGNLNAGEAPDLILGVPFGASAANARREAGEVRVLFGVRR
ncbi:MAG: Ig-like domain-containing protein [Blastocatellia bacterium]|nr:Ig-like domain-containing protein [Blastocatellia bacterium]